MKERMGWTFLIAGSLLVSGCAPKQTSFTPLAVRFVAPTGPTSFTDDGSTTGSKLVADSSDVGLSDSDQRLTPGMDDWHVMLWGGSFDGADVTLASAPLQPGHYTFGFWDDDHDAPLQGAVQVNTNGTDLLDTLQRWRQALPKQKEWLAYDFELKGKLNTPDATVFKSFARQLRAFNRLERRLDEVIASEQAIQNEQNERNRQFLQKTRILVLPGGTAFFEPTTRPAFTENDVKTVRSGQEVTKLIMMTDYNNARNRLRMVNRLCRDLTGCRSVLGEEVDRLERRKRFLAFTDHVYDHDRKFVENEMRLQQTLAAIDHLNEQIEDLRDRRLAIAFTTALVADDASFSPLHEEQRDLEQERIVMQAKKKRLDLLFDESTETGPRRIAIERQRQRFIRATETVDRQLAMLDEARTVLTAMKDSTDVIHREGNSRLFTAGFVSTNTPFRIREAVQREALMSVRLTAVDGKFTPAGANNPTTARTASFKSSTGQ